MTLGDLTHQLTIEPVTEDNNDTKENEADKNKNGVDLDGALVSPSLSGELSKPSQMDVTKSYKAAFKRISQNPVFKMAVGMGVAKRKRLSKKCCEQHETLR